MKQNIKILFQKWENISLGHCKSPKALIKYSNDVVYENIEEYNPKNTIQRMQSIECI